jgi:hypothetical protein
MVHIRYTYWDGSQKLKLDADKVFEKLAEFLSYSDDIRQAMDWMMRQGMDFDGVKVQGLEEFLEQLRQEMRQRYRDFNLKNSLSELEEKLDQILDQERQTLDSMRGQKDGVEDKERQLQQMPRRLSEALRKPRPTSTICYPSTRISATSRIFATATITCSTAPRVSITRNRST